MKIFVLGDYGIDHYTIGKVRGVSAEAPIPILDVTQELDLAGMAANVAENLRIFGVESHLFSHSDAFPIKHRLLTEDGVQLARWDEHDTCPTIPVTALSQLLGADAIIVSDYGKGAITPALVEALRDCKIPLFVDTKRDPVDWIGSEAYFFPNLAEYQKYQTSYEWLERVVLKKGPEGVAYLSFGNVVLQRPSKARSVRCVNGAGDTVIASFALSILAGCPIIEALELSQLAAGVVVEQPFSERVPNTKVIMERWQSEQKEQSNKGATGSTSDWSAFLSPSDSTNSNPVPTSDHEFPHRSPLQNGDGHTRGTEGDRTGPWGYSSIDELIRITFDNQLWPK